MDTIRFDNNIHYMVVSPIGKVEQEGDIHNAVGVTIKDLILKALTTQNGASAGTLMSVQGMGFRTDGSALLGTYLTWHHAAATAYSTRYNNTSSLTSVGFNATYTATANTTVKSVILEQAVGYADSIDVATTALFYSTSMSMSVGSAGKIIVQWTVGAV